MNLVRDRQYQSLRGRLGTSSLRRVSWVHLAQGVEGGSTVDWDGCSDPSPAHQKQPRARNIIDELISAIRTDLDAFSEAESYVLMTNGYRMIERALARERQSGEAAPAATAWPFLSIEPIMEGDRGHQRAHKRLLVLLKASSETLFKLWRIVPTLGLATAGFIALTVSALLYEGWNHTGSLTLRAPTVVALALVLVATGVLLAVSRRVVPTQASLGRLAVTIIALVAWIPARLQLHVLDPLFLRLGRFDRLPRD
jgi:hypothetical protein